MTKLPANSTFDYTAFGTEYHVTGGTVILFRFNGQWGLVRPSSVAWLLYAMQRWVDVVRAQWASRDLIGFPGGWNLYEFVRNNPVNLVDAGGLTVDMTLPNCCFYGLPCCTQPAPGTSRSGSNSMGATAYTNPASGHTNVTSSAAGGYNCSDHSNKYGNVGNSISYAMLLAIENYSNLYCAETCPNLSSLDFACQVFAESDGNPSATNGINRGLLQISSNIWSEYKCAGDFSTQWSDPIANIACGIKAMCAHPAGAKNKCGDLQGFQCN